MTEQHARELAGKLIAFLETGDAPEGLFAPDVFCDYTPPLWRLQARGPEAVSKLRTDGHPGPSKVTSWRCDPTPKGFVLEYDERWDDDGKPWYARQILRADVVDGSITELAVYCTGDWSAERCAQHAREVRLLRP